MYSQMKEISLPQKSSVHDNKKEMPPTPPQRQKTQFNNNAPMKEPARPKPPSHHVTSSHNDRQNIGKMFPVNMSYVSIQAKGDKSAPPDGGLVPPVAVNTETPSPRKNVGRSGNFAETHPGLRQGAFKFERSKTLMGTSRKGDHRVSTLKSDNALQGNMLNTQTQTPPGPDIVSPTTSLDKPVLRHIPTSKSLDSNASRMKSEPSSQPGSSKQSRELPASRSPVKTPSSFHEERRSSVKSSSDRAISAEQSLHYSRRKSKEFALPKPERPSQRYLEGSHGNDAVWASRSLPSPRTYHELTNSMDSPEIEAVTKRLVSLVGFICTLYNYPRRIEFYSKCLFE